MTEHNQAAPGSEVPGDDFGSVEGTPATGLSLDDGRVEFAPREVDQAELAHGRPGAPPTDEEIAAQVGALMAETGGVDHSGIQVQVRGSEVTLEGHVASEEERRLAENVALAVSSVRVVYNQLQVRPPGIEGEPS